MRVVHLLALFAHLLLAHSLSGAHADNAELRVSAIIFACSRPSHLRKTLRSLAEQHPTARKQVDLYISIDAHRRAKHVHRAAESETQSLGIHLSEIWQHPAPSTTLDVRARIARHYHLGLSRLFATSPPPSHAIILEDDLDLSPDFLSFLLAFAPYTSAHPSKGPAAISGWNDNGASSSSPGTSDVHLTSLFPGLGWLLPREVWEAIKPGWPTTQRARKEDVEGGCDAKRKFPMASVAPTGWDWWLRAEFQARGWTTLYPLLGRVAHRGATGANVDAGQQQAVFAGTRIAGRTEGLSVEGWRESARRARTVGSDFRGWLDAREKEGVAVNALSEIPRGTMAAKDGGQGNGTWYMLRLQEREFPGIARRMRLWPHPRGFFEGRLALPLQDGHTLLLTRSAVRSRQGRLQPFLAEVNMSCADACGSGGRECSEVGITQLNFCDVLAERFECGKGCAFETGEDIPAVVERGAPLETRGMCVVTEDAASIGCGGRFRHTRRVCVCDEEGDREGERARSRRAVQSNANNVNGRNKDEL